MIDYIKIDLSQCNRNHLLFHLGLDFKQRLHIMTGELENSYTASWRGYNIVVKPVVMFLSGSMHKAINNEKGLGEQNYIDITHCNLIKEVEKICSFFSLKAELTKIQVLEYSVNVETDRPPRELMIDKIIAWNNFPISKNQDYKGLGKSYEWKRSQIKIKLYDKSAQMNLPNNLLRFEKQIFKSENLNRIGIKFLSDLCEKPNIEALQEDLLKEWYKITMIDNLFPEGLSTMDVKAFESMTNPKYLESYSQAKSNSVMARKQHSRYKKRFSAIIEQNGLDETKRRIESSIKAKFDRWKNVTN